MSIKRLSGAGLTTPKTNKLWDQTTFQSGMFALATISLTSSQSSVTFSGIPAKYTHLQIRWIARNTSNDVDGASENMRIQFNGITTAKYPFHYLEGNGTSASASAGTTDTSFFSARFPMSNATANAFGAGIVDILDYSNTSKYKTLRHLGGSDKNGSGYIGLYSGVEINDTNAITSITMFPQLNNFVQYSHFALYGIKNA